VQQNWLPYTGRRIIKLSMKVIGLLIVVMLLAGCSTSSKFVHDPRAAQIGPAYLDYIAEYPPDRDTQFYYPSFTISGREKWVDPTTTLLPSPMPDIDTLLTHIPEPSRAVKDITGKGYPQLEQESGLLVFTGPNNQVRLTKLPSTSFFSQFWP
jgi:hypothetical protein